MTTTMVDPVVITIQEFRHQFDQIMAARPDYRDMRHEMSMMRKEAGLGAPAKVDMSTDLVADALSKVVAFRARETGFAVAMVNYWTLWNEIEDDVEFEMKSIRRQTSTRSEIRALSEKRQALAIDAAVPHALFALQAKIKVQRRFAEAMKESVFLELAQMDRAYEMVSRIETLILDERRITAGPRTGT